MSHGRPTLYKGIRMRSRLEADYARYLDDFLPRSQRAKKTWEYEPECFAGPGGQWLPDFRLSYPEVPGSPRTYVEVKPASLLDEVNDIGGSIQEKVDPVLRRMSVAWLSEPHAVLELVIWEFGAAAPIAELTGVLAPDFLGPRCPVREGYVWQLRHRGRFGNVPLLWPHSIQPPGMDEP